MGLHKGWLGALLAAACTLAVTAVAEDAAAPKIGMFDFGAKKVEKALAAGDANGAEAALLEAEPKLAEKPYYRHLLTSTVMALQADLKPRLSSALAGLTAVNGRAKFADNTIADVAAALATASSALAAINPHPLLQRPEFALPEAAEINAQLAAAGGNLQKNVKTFFLQHNHAESGFFEIYPLQLGDEDRRALVAINDRWITVAVASDQPGPVLARYLPWANEKMQAQARAALSAQLIRRNKWRAPLSVAQQFHLSVQFAQELMLPANDVALVSIGSEAPDVPGVEKRRLAPSEAALAPLVDELKRDGVRYLLVVDLSRIVVWEQLRAAGKPETSKKVVGTRRVPNPAYAQAQQAVGTAQQNLAAAQQRAASAQANAQIAGALFSQFGGQDSSSGWAALAGKTVTGMGAASANSGVSMAQQQLTQAQVTLANTPTEIDESVEQPYSVQTRLGERVKVQELGIYYADLQSRVAQSVSPRETAKKSVPLMVLFDANDRHVQELLERNNTQMNDVRMELGADFASESVFRRLEDPLSQAAGGESRTGVDLAGLVAADTQAWESWKAGQMAQPDVVAMIDLERIYSVGQEKPKQEAAPVVATAAVVMPAGLTDPDSILWYETKATGTIEAYEWYIERFPNGLRVGPARSEIRKLQAAGQDAQARAEEEAIARREEQQRAAEAAVARRAEEARQAEIRRQEEEQAAIARAEQQKRQAAADAERKKKEDRERREGAATIPSF